MPIVEKEFSLDVVPGYDPPVIHVSEYDVGRRYSVSILNDGAPLNLHPNLIATIEGTVEDFINHSEKIVKAVFKDITANIEDNKVIFNLTEEMTAYKGHVWCKIKFKAGTEAISTCGFILDVDRAGAEAEVVINARGFDKQIKDAVTEYLDEEGFESNYVSYNSVQNLSAEQKYRARKNIDALDYLVVTVDENNKASMNAFEIFDAVQNGKNVILRWPMPNFNDGYYICKLENIYTTSGTQASAWFSVVVGSDLHWYYIDGDGNARASKVVPIGGISLPNPDGEGATGKVLMSNGANYYLGSIPELSSDQMYDYIVESDWWDEAEDGDRAHFYAAMAAAAKRSGDPRLPVITEGTNGYVVKVYNGNYYLLPDATGGGSGGAVNSVNGQTPDETGDVKLTIPSKTSQLTNDSKYVKENEVASIVDAETKKREARVAALNENEKVVSLSTRADLGSLISGNQWKRYKTDGGYYSGAVFYNPEKVTIGGSSADIIRLDKGYFIGVYRGGLFPSPEGLIDWVFLSYPDLEPIYAYDPENGVFYPAGSLADETVEAAQADAEEFLTWLDSNSDPDYTPVIRDVADPVLDSDVATKGYVDNRTVRIIISDDGRLPTDHPTVGSILDEIRAGKSVIGYWWMTDHHFEDESYVLLYPSQPVLGQQEGIELTGTYWHGAQRKMVIMSGQDTDDTLTISFVNITQPDKERDSQIVTPSRNVPTTETAIYTHTVTNAGHYLITANACGQYTSTTVDRALTLSIKVNGTVKAQTISTSASSWYAECALSINEELAKNDAVAITILASKDSLAVKGVWHAGICQLV